jgi:hypothetical protein
LEGWIARREILTRDRLKSIPTPDMDNNSARVSCRLTIDALPRLEQGIPAQGTRARRVLCN